MLTVNIHGDSISIMLLGLHIQLKSIYCVRMDSDKKLRNHPIIYNEKFEKKC